MDRPRGANAGAPTRFWPSHTPPGDGEGVETECARCDQPWRVHSNLSGYRLRCICGGWVRVPYPEAVVRSARAAAAASARLAPPGFEGAEGERTPAGAAGERLRGADLAATPEPALLRRPGGADPRGALPSRESRRATDRAILELVLLAIALIAPPTVALLAFGPERFVRWLPVTSLAGGVLVLVIALASGAFGLDGLRGARLRHFLEAIAAAAVSVALATGFIALLERSGSEVPDLLGSIVGTLGVPLALFVVALCPAVFEEIAFRGVVQGRLIALLGRRTGVLVTAVAFALAHGFGPATPIHLVLGAYLGDLRLRSGSLIPGMLFHGLYNGALVLLARPV